MDSMADEGILVRLDLLERRLGRIEHRAQLHKSGWIILAMALALVFFWTERLGVAQEQSQPGQKIRVRELDIVDEKGRERIVIAAPLPEPLVDGKVGHRVRRVSAAVQFKAANGNEQGGIAMSDDGSMLVGIDDERGHERAHLYYLPKRGSGVALTGENGTQSASLLLPNGGGDPTLSMTDKAGKVILQLPSNK
ncbi:MAG: hypothetical protein JO033_27395 [Acidobacteriaceae bacterium]|nr:hypothetical protein [Acidobacteriaceae bacterium]MBV9498473.1 hypothetical protein [Acidobacteriaceae bacterium]